MEAGKTTNEAIGKKVADKKAVLAADKAVSEAAEAATETPVEETPAEA